MKRLAALLGVFLVAGFLLTIPAAHAACNSWDNPYEYDCWGRWITDAPAKYDEAKGDPFTITGGNKMHSGSWLFGIEGTKTPNADVPISGSATYNGHLFGRASGGPSARIFPVTGDVKLYADFNSGSNTDLDVSFTGIQVHRKTTGENPVDLPSVRFKFDNDDANGVIGGRQDADAVGRVGRNGFDVDYDDHGIQWPSSKEFYNWRLRRMYRDAAITGDFYGPNAEGVAGQFYFVEGQFSGNQTGSRPGKTEIRASESGLSSCSSNCGTVYWQVEGTWGAVK